jgi:hypothetical protein
MSEPTLKQLAERVTDIEQRLHAQEQLATKKDWRSVVGLFDNCAIMTSIIAEGKALREADRRDLEPGLKP